MEFKVCATHERELVCVKTGLWTLIEGNNGMPIRLYRCDMFSCPVDGYAIALANSTAHVDSWEEIFATYLEEFSKQEPSQQIRVRTV